MIIWVIIFLRVKLGNNLLLTDFLLLIIISLIHAQ